VAHENKYTVHQRLGQLENAVTELRRENTQLRTHLTGALQTAVNDAKHSFRDGRDGFDGKDGATGPQGIQGERGDLCYVGTDEVQAAAAVVRAELVAKHAKFLGAIDQAISENGGSSSIQKIVRARLEQVRRDAGLI
jgi:hypothetical protein